MAFGSPQFAQIFAQGVQMLTAAFDRGAQLQQQQTEMESQFAIRKQAMDAKAQELKSQEKYQQLEYDIKTQQLKKVEQEVELIRARRTSLPARQAMQAQLDALNVSLKQHELKEKTSVTDAEREAIKKNKMEQEGLDKELKLIQVADAQHKTEQLDARSADPNQYSRTFQSLAELTRERERFQKFFADPFGMHAAGKNLDIEQLKKDAAAIDQSIVFRTDFLAKKYSRTRDDATQEIIEVGPQTAPHAMASGQVAKSQADLSLGPGSSPPPQAEYGQLLQNTMSNDEGIKKASLSQIRQRMVDAARSGNLVAEQQAFINSFPGTPAEKQKLAQDMLDTLRKLPTE